MLVGETSKTGWRGGRLAAFTLIELLVVMAIIAVLTTLVSVAANAMIEAGRKVKEVQAAKQLITAYNLHAAASDGELLKGYDKTANFVTLSSGYRVSGEMVCRYPWRLAPHLGEHVDDIFLLNGTKTPTKGLSPDSFEYRYRVSLNPPLGINAYCVGGFDDGAGSGYFSKDVVTRLAQAARPSKLIVFASARMKQTAKGEETPGNFIVNPPRLWRMKWDGKFDRDKPSSNFGNVDPRWGGRALCAFLDGSVRELDTVELQDMRLWSNTAAEEDNAEFIVPR